MLILTRRVEDKITIGDETTVKVLAVKGEYVRLGISAPKRIAVHREEVYRSLKQREARSPDPALNVEGASTGVET